MDTYKIMIKVYPHHHQVHAPFLYEIHAIRTIYFNIVMRYMPPFLDARYKSWLVEIQSINMTQRWRLVEIQPIKVTQIWYTIHHHEVHTPLLYVDMICYHHHEVHTPFLDVIEK